MKTKTIIHILLLCSFALAQGMEIIKSDNNEVTDAQLQKLVKHVNDSSLHIVNILKATRQEFPLTTQTMRLLFNLDQDKINDLFLNNVKDDELRPLLLHMGADIKVRTEDQRNCLWRIQKPELLKELISRGAEVDIIDESNYTPVTHLLTFYGNEPTTPEITKILLTHSINRKIHFQDGNLLIHMIEKEATDLVELLLNEGADANAQNQFREYPLHQAMQQYSLGGEIRKIVPKIVILLLQHNANPNQSYPDGQTMPLHVATQRKQPEIIKALIQYGARTTEVDGHYNTAYTIAKKLGYKQDILDLLKLKEEILTFSMADFQEPQPQDTRWIKTENCSIQ